MGATRPSTREALIEGALRCLREKGYARTTSREIATASGANLALIGYYFGSKEALLTEALMEGFRRWMERLGRLTRDRDEPDPIEWLRVGAQELQRAFEDERPLLIAFVEALAQSERSEALRAQLADGYEELREATARVVRRVVDGEDEAQLIASLLMAATDGLMVQWLIDPSRAPRPEAIVERLDLMAQTGSRGAFEQR